MPFFSYESVNNGNDLQVSLSGFHGNNLSLYMLAIKMLCSLQHMFASTKREDTGLSLWSFVNQMSLFFSSSTVESWCTVQTWT